MKSSLIKVYRIGDSEEYKGIRELGFNKCKRCGEGPEGLVLALGLGYLEEMAVRQNYLFNNLIFFQGLNVRLDDLKMVGDLVAEIMNGKADQAKIVTLAKVNDEFLEQVLEFSKRVFDVEGELQSILDVLNFDRFQIALGKVNVQIGIYSYSGIIDEIVLNRAAYPVTINLLIQDWSGQVMNLYHENYTEIKTENFNTSDRFIPDKYSDYITPLEELSLILIKKMPSAQAHLSLELNSLKQYSLYNFLNNL